VGAVTGQGPAGPPRTGTWKAGDWTRDHDGVVWTATRDGAGRDARWHPGRVSASEFEISYAARCVDMTVEQLHRWGRWAEPCSCGQAVCQGWIMGHQWEDAITENEIRDGRLA
jgi:hypothetical protein